MDDSKLIDSPLCQTVAQGQVSVKICIYRLEHTKWSLEIVAQDGNSTVWDDLYDSDAAALAEGLKAIEEDGVASFSEQPGQIKAQH